MEQLGEADESTEYTAKYTSICGGGVITNRWNLLPSLVVDTQNFLNTLHTIAFSFPTTTPCYKHSIITTNLLGNPTTQEIGTGNGPIHTRKYNAHQVKHSLFKYKMATERHL